MQGYKIENQSLQLLPKGTTTTASFSKYQGYSYHYSIKEKEGYKLMAMQQAKIPIRSELAENILMYQLKNVNTCETVKYYDYYNSVG